MYFDEGEGERRGERERGERERGETGDGEGGRERSEIVLEIVLDCSEKRVKRTPLIFLFLVLLIFIFDRIQT